MMKKTIYNSLQCLQNLVVALRPKQQEYKGRIQEWEALRPHLAEVKVRGNHMTQKYYTKRLLPVYIKAIQKARLRDAGPWLFQEDGDPSHGIRKTGLAQKLKEDN
jgi:hypothetical protein